MWSSSRTCVIYFWRCCNPAQLASLQQTRRSLLLDALAAWLYALCWCVCLFVCYPPSVFLRAAGAKPHQRRGAWPRVSPRAQDLARGPQVPQHPPRRRKTCKGTCVIMLRTCLSICDLKGLVVWRRVYRIGGTVLRIGCGQEGEVFRVGIT